MMLGSYQVEKYTERAAYLSSNFFQLSWILNHVHDIPKLNLCLTRTFHGYIHYRYFIEPEKEKQNENRMTTNTRLFNKFLNIVNGVV